MFKRLDFWLGCGYVFVLGFRGFGFSMAGCVMCVCCVHVMVLLWMCVYVLCNACEHELCVKMVACVLCVL